MDINEIEVKLEELDIDPALLEEVIHKMSAKELEVAETNKDAIVNSLKIKLNETDNWMEKAQIAAKIISINLS